jgi:hypothetical protein
VLTRAGFDALAARVDNAGRWGSDDELGTLNFLTGQRRLDAARLVRTGAMVSCARPFHPSGTATPHPGSGAARLTLEFDEGPDTKAVNDRLLLSMHGQDAPTHLDALAHFFYRGTGYNNRPVRDVSPTGVSANAVTSSQSPGAVLAPASWHGNVPERSISRICLPEGARVLASPGTAPTPDQGLRQDRSPAVQVPGGTSP